MKVILRCLAALAVLSGIAAGCRSQDDKASGSKDPSATQGHMAPDFKLTDLTGKPLTLSEYKGKVVFLDFWATWCPPCVMSTPEVEKIVADYKAKDVVVLSISLDQNEEALRQFVQARNIENRVALAGPGGVDQLYNVHAIPQFFIVDQKGYVANAWEGFNPAFPGQWRKELDRLLSV